MVTLRELAHGGIASSDRELGTCPLCASCIPHESHHGAYCGSGVEPGEP